jgi:ribosomal protein S18 acetylase RimI-like enzyme
MIRLAQAQDEVSVVTSVRAAYAPHIARIGREPGPMTSDYGDLIARGLVYVLQLEGTESIVGVLVLRLAPPTMWIENVAVHPEHQHQGFGRQLLAFAEAQARDANATELRLYANHVMVENIALYERLGYRETERRPQRGYHRVFMRKAI